MIAVECSDSMGMIQEIHSELEFLRADAMVNFSLAEAKRLFLEMLDAIARHKSKKVLLDGRKLTGNIETIERFYYAVFAAYEIKEAAHQGVSPNTQFAYVLREPILDPQRFGETVAVNRGLFVKAFDNLEQALSWLGISPTRKAIKVTGNTPV